jgi:uncharacterized protein (TIGR02466 family)
MEYNVRNLFPIPLFEVILDEELIKEEVDFVMRKIREENILHVNENNLASDESFVLDSWNLKGIKNCIEVSLKTFIDNVLEYDYEDFYITQSWVNVNAPGDSHHYHRHPNSVLSGILYLNTGKDCGDVVFHRPESHYRNIEPKVNFNEENYLTWSTVHFAPQNNQLFIFPSNLYHSVSKNVSLTIDRVSLSFNTFMNPLGYEDRKTFLSTK